MIRDGNDGGRHVEVGECGGRGAIKKRRKEDKGRVGTIDGECRGADRGEAVNLLRSCFL